MEVGFFNIKILKFRMPITIDIAEFNNGPPNNQQFKDLLFAYYQSLLNLASSIVILEYNMHLGVKNINSQVVLNF